MASSNRHWPSMFKSKPHHHQWQHDINSPPLPSSASHRSSSFSGCEVERSPEPKPRWNPKPEQIRVLEAIFNSGMVNPPREEIRRIRAQLQEYGQVGDANDELVILAELDRILLPQLVILCRYLKPRIKIRGRVVSEIALEEDEKMSKPVAYRSLMKKTKRPFSRLLKFD
ncbi:hypothetical protein F2Q68_00001366 [Brassica cretica]|uniref:Uncharacterized protein n=1 Tax=Brassica cretica TaxID=69181 RepID=A0A8S9JN59_BRACR|nr:hypothetical protein F2Q68_00001366 [Brassica cretica]